MPRWPEDPYSVPCHPGSGPLKLVHPRGRSVSRSGPPLARPGARGRPFLGIPLAPPPKTSHRGPAFTARLTFHPRVRVRSEARCALRCGRSKVHQPANPPTSARADVLVPGAACWVGLPPLPPILFHSPNGKAVSRTEGARQGLTRPARAPRRPQLT